MKIKLPFNYQLKIKKHYRSLKNIMPIGSDCHPAYMVSKLELRKESLPFDWLDTKPLLALNYAQKNITERFSFFLKDLKMNEAEKVFADKYPHALFYHFDDLIDNKQLQNKIEQRINRFLKLYDSDACYFLHTLTSSCIQSSEDLDCIKQSIYNFKLLLKKDDELILYLRFDESYDENYENAKILQEFVDSLLQVRLVKYLRFKSKFGIWGDEAQYKRLIKELGIKTRFNGFKFTIQKLKKPTR